MKIAFFAKDCVPFDCYTLIERPIGGIETAIIHLTNSLNALGHKVTVYTPKEKPRFGDVRYLNCDEPIQECDVFISVRSWLPLIFNIPCQKRFLWTGDNSDQIQTFGMGDKRFSKCVDGFLAVSNWQANDLCRLSGFPTSKTYVLRNGINLNHFTGTEERNPSRLIYTSTPFRGLELIPLLVKPLQESHPETEWHIFSGYAVYDGAPVQELEDEWTVLQAELRKFPNVFLHGNITSPELAREFMKSGILAYPNIYKETSCISVMEAQAAGVPTVTSNLGALPETVGDTGIIIDGDTRNFGTIIKYINSIRSILDNPGKWEMLSKKCLERSTKCSWDVIATEFVSYLKTVHKLK